MCLYSGDIRPRNVDSDRPRSPESPQTATRSPLQLSLHSLLPLRSSLDHSVPTRLRAPPSPRPAPQPLRCRGAPCLSAIRLSGHAACQPWDRNGSLRFAAFPCRFRSGPFRPHSGSAARPSREHDGPFRPEGLAHERQVPCEAASMLLKPRGHPAAQQTSVSRKAAGMQNASITDQSAGAKKQHGNKMLPQRNRKNPGVRRSRQGEEHQVSAGRRPATANSTSRYVPSRSRSAASGSAARHSTIPDCHRHVRAAPAKSHKQVRPRGEGSHRDALAAQGNAKETR